MLVFAVPACQQCPIKTTLKLAFIIIGPQNQTASVLIDQLQRIYPEIICHYFTSTGCILQKNDIPTFNAPFHLVQSKKNALMGLEVANCGRHMSSQGPSVGFKASHLYSG